VSQSAFDVVRQIEEKTNDASPPELVDISAYMAAIGRKGGKIGGKRRLETMSPEQRSKIASDAARAMWTKRRAAKKR
jgi:hypothetical protein